MGQRQGETSGEKINILSVLNNQERYCRARKQETKHTCRFATTTA
jgi:hypothetical protein